MSSKPWNGEERRKKVAAEPFVFGTSTETAAGAATAAAQAAGPAADPLAYQEGFAEGEARARANFEKTLEGLRAEVAATLKQFALQRQDYFQQVERDVVQLALSIARKILHREVQMDPLLLAGVVRVALESLNGSTQVRLRAHPAEIPLWRNYFQDSAASGAAPELIGDPSLASGCCTLETEMGSTQISLETQLKEIEQGFLDLLVHRPAGRS
jgi:flagellar assembly protein FliH